MKLLLLALILTTCSYTTTAQVITDNGTTITVNNSTNNSPDLSGYSEIDIPTVEDNYFIQGLLNFGSQYVLGNAIDSQLVHSGGGNYSTIYSAKEYSGDTFNLSTDLSIYSYDGSNLHSKFLVSFNPDKAERELLWFTFEWSNYSLINSSGVNITYDAAQDQYQVLTFDGIEQTLNYKNEDFSNQTTSYSSDDFLHKYANYTALNVSDLSSNQTLQFSLNAALRGLRQQASYGSLLYPNYGDLNVTTLYSIDSNSVNGTGSYFRYDFEFNTANQSGRAVCVVLCPTYNSYYPPYYPFNPLNIKGNGDIISSSASEKATDFAPLYYEEEASFSPDASNQVEVPVSEPVNQANMTNQTAEASSGAANSTNSTNSTSSGPIATNFNPANTGYYYGYNCLYGYLDHYWFVNFKETA